MTGIRIGSRTFASVADALRLASPGDLIQLDPGRFSAPFLLAFAQRTTLRGAGASNPSILINTPILERSGQGKEASDFTIQDLVFQYNNQDSYLFAPSIGSVPYNPTNPTLTSFRLKDVAFTGAHQGNAGVSGTYMDLSGAKNTIFDGIRVSLTGQAGYDPRQGTGGGFFVFHEGGAGFQLINSEFNEAGYGSSIILLFMPDARVTSNRFIGAGLIKQDDGTNPADDPRGERFYNAGGIFANNHLSNGAFFDFLLNFNSDPGAVWAHYKTNFATADGTYGLKTSVTGNTFDLISSGYGVLIRADVSPETVEKMLTITGNVFNNGLAVRSELTGAYDLTFGANIVNGIRFDFLRVGGRANDRLNEKQAVGKNWISGGPGNDQLYSSANNFDAFVFYAPPNASTNLDTIFNFEAGGPTPDQIWLDADTFRGLLGNGDRLDTRSFTANETGLASGSAGQIIYNNRTGELLYDADGSGGNQAAIAFAILSGKESVGNQHFRLFNRGSSPLTSPAVISLDVTPAAVAEDGAANLNYTFSRTGPTTSDLTVNYTIAGTAESSDYSGATPGTGKSITFAAGSTTATLSIDPTADSTFEATETVTLSLNSGSGYSIGTPAAVTGFINNDDASNSFALNWLQLLGGSGDDIGYAVATGLDGDIYVGGETEGAWDGHRNQGGKDAFVTRFSSSGTRSWSTWWASNSNEDARDLTLGKDGSIYVGGGTFGAVDGNPSAGNSDGILSRVDPSGRKNWTLQYGGQSNEYARRVVAAPDDTGVYIIGFTRGFAGLPQAPSGEGGPDAYVMKVSKDKKVLWATRIGNGLDDWGMDLSVGSDGSLYALGFAGTSTNRSQAFLSRLNPDNGSVQWTNLIGGPTNDYGMSITTGNDGFVYAAISLDDVDIAIHKYSPDGRLIWNIPVGSPLEDRAADLIMGPDGALYLTGTTLGNLGGQVNRGQSDAFVTKISTQGQIEWTRLLGSTGNDAGADLAFAANGDLILVGETSGTLAGQTPSGGRDAFVASLSIGLAPAPLPAVSVAVSASEIQESGYTKLVYSFRRTGATDQPLSVSFSLAGSADQQDYLGASAGSNTLTFARGSASAELVLTPISDGIKEKDETIILTINPQAGYTIDGPSSRSSTIKEITNSEPVATARATLLATVTSPLLQGQLSSLDPDQGDSAVYTLLTPAPAGFLLNDNGSWSFNPLNYANLAKGTSQTLTLAYRVDDGVAWVQPALPQGVVRVGGANSAFATIQEAIDRSPAGSILYIAPGTYNENLTINKEIHLLGAFYGIPATDKERGKAGAESTIRGFINAGTSASQITLDGLHLIGSAGPDFRGVNARIQSDSARLVNTIVTTVGPESGGYTNPAAIHFRKDANNLTPYASVVVENNLFQGNLDHSARPDTLQINNSKYARIENNTFLQTGGGGNIVLTSNFDKAIVRGNFTLGGGRGFATFDGIFQELAVEDNTFLQSNLNGTEINSGSKILSGTFKGNIINGSGIDIANSKYSDVFANLLVSQAATVSPQFEISNNDFGDAFGAGAPYKGIQLSSPQLASSRRTNIETLTLEISNPQVVTSPAIPLARPLDAARFNVTRFASGLGFPSSMVDWGANAILAATTLGDPSKRNSPYGSSPSQLVLLADTNLDGISDRQQVLATLPGFVTSVRAAANLVFALSTARPGPPTITVFRRGPSPTDPLEEAGKLTITFPAGFLAGDSVHTSYALAARSSPTDANTIELYFNIGSSNENRSTDPSLRVALGASGPVSFPGGSMPPESIQRVLVRDLGQSLSISAPRTIATGLRNAAGIGFDPAGNLIFQDNGFSGDPDQPGAPRNDDISFSADELNTIPASQIGVVAPDFGFGKSYVRSSDGVTVNPSPSVQQPVVSFLPTNGRKSEGAVEVSQAPAGFPSDFATTVFTNFYGKSAVGTANNDENPVVAADPTTGAYYHFINSGILGNPSGLLATGDHLYLADFTSLGVFYNVSNATPADKAGIIYRISPKNPATYSSLPSVMGPRGTEAILSWQTSADTSSILELWEGSTPKGTPRVYTARSTAAGSGFLTSVTLGGLKPSTAYTYRTRFGAQESEGSFTTDGGSPPPLPSISLTVSPPSVLEDGSTNLTYTFSRSGPNSSPLTVNYSVAGSATLGSDFNILGSSDSSLNRSVSFAANSSTATVIVDPITDQTVENNETVALTLSSGTGYSITTTAPVVGTITNDDLPLPSISLTVSPASVAEDGSSNLLYTFSRTGPTTSPLSVNYSVAGSATLNTDYNQSGAASISPTAGTVTFLAGSAIATVTIDPINDTTAETNETISLTLSSGIGYTNATTTSLVGTILNDDSDPSSGSTWNLNWGSATPTYDWSLAKPLGTPSILSTRVAITSPRSGEQPLAVTALRIDLRDPAISLTSTGRRSDWTNNTVETTTQTSRQFITSARANGLPVVAAINTAPFDLDLANQFNSVPTNVRGFSVSEGQLVSSTDYNGDTFKSTFFYDSITGARIQNLASSIEGFSLAQKPYAPPAAELALASSLKVATSGFGIVLSNGMLIARDKVTQNARSGLGITADGRYLTMLTVDRAPNPNQPNGWQGATDYDVGAILLGFGASMGINLDGGGSTQMAWWNPSSNQAELLSRPLAERYVGTSLGVLYQPIA